MLNSHRQRLAGASAVALVAAILAADLFATTAHAADTQQANSAAAPGKDAPVPQSGEVVVTAQFRAQRLQSTPIAITAITGAMLEARSEKNTLDLANEAPNVTLKPGTQAFGPSMQAYIRGVGQSDFNFAFEPGVGIYVDDVYYSTLTGSILDLLDLNRVEIERGPQGTLSGMNSIGGSVKLYSKKPSGDDGGYLEGTYGSYNRLDFRGSGDFTLIPDQLFIRVSGVGNSQDGYVTRYDYGCTHPGLVTAGYVFPSAQDSPNCKTGTEGGKHYDALRASLRWTPNARLEVNVAADTTSEHDDAIPQTLLYVGTTTHNGATLVPGASAYTYPRFSTATNPAGGFGPPGLDYYYPAGRGPNAALGHGYSPFITNSFLGEAGDTFSNSPYVTYSTYCDLKPSDGSAAWCANPATVLSSSGVSMNVDYRLTNSINFTSISSYRRYDAQWAQDEDASPLSNELLTYDLWHWQWSEEARLTGKLFDDRVDWVVGGFYFKQNSMYGARNELGTSDYIARNLSPSTDQAVFANVDWRVTDKFEVNAGLRYSTEVKAFLPTRIGVEGETTSPPVCPSNGQVYVPAVPAAVCGLNGTSGHFKGDHLDYRLVAQYQWTPALMTYASVATGYKGGGVNPRPFYPIQEAPFGPETLTAYELGVKSQWFEHRLQADLSVFDNKYDNLQIAGVQSGSAITFSPCVADLVANPSHTNCSFVINGGNADISGAELEATARPIDGLSIDASLSYLHYKYSYLSPLAQSAGIEYGMLGAYAPTWKYSIGAQYEIELGSAGSLTPRLDYAYQDVTYTNDANTPLARIPAYGLLNGRLTWKAPDGKLTAALEVTNLTNKLYYLNVYSNGSAFAMFGEPGPPREWALTVKKTF